ncbi:protoheme IX farnesyltransferase [Buchnera aphidicola (Muscaphis stroyani)]|uniref:Protoheme IX farnesyltransferase n=1 Tax=Buchnera aphidicola (Muscaphis stroyani) TaxID=1241869 RepID=A0A4D6Y4A2_9GAMM|nr:heme o synthase [Buchnera aphidicola]QCI24506.1 protoheme IX farnesyltransferase [Buchnera aphidicola (Muscaphis stroyani)]
MIISIKHYCEIIKPGIIFGNIILIMGGFLFSSHIKFSPFLFLNTILGTSLVMASACVLNNLIDFDIDQKMKRTKNRVLARKLIKPINAIIFSLFLGIIGVFILGYLVNYLSMFLSVFGFLVYVFLYTLIYKRNSIYSTFVGSFSGSIPSVIGHTAATNNINLCAVLFFITFVFWQMAHFYSISIFRLNDYKNAKIPVFSVIKGVYLTKKHIVYYIVGFIISNIILKILNYISDKCLFFLFIIDFFWLYLSFVNLNNRNKENHKNSLQLFYFSIVVVVMFNFLISLDFIF